MARPKEQLLEISGATLLEPSGYTIISFLSWDYTFPEANIRIQDPSQMELGKSLSGRSLGLFGAGCEFPVGYILQLVSTYGHESYLSRQSTPCMDSE